MNTSELWHTLRDSLIDSFYNEVTEENLSRGRRPVILLDKKVKWSPSVEVEKLWKKLSELDEQIVLAKQDYKNTLIEFDCRWDFAQQKIKDLQELYPKLDLYHKGCFVAKTRYRKRELKEREELQRKCQESRRCKKEIACLETVKKEIDSRLANFLIFKKYLQSVANERNDEFKDLHSLMKSFDDQLTFKHSLYEKTTANILDRLERLNNFSEFEEKKVSEIISSCSYLNNWKVQIPKLNQSNLRKEDILYMGKEHSQKQLRAVGCLKSGIRNLYLLLCDQMNQPITLKEDDYGNQCRFIEKYMKEVEKLRTKGKIALEATSEAVAVPKSCYEERGKKSYYHISKKTDKSVPKILKSSAREASKESNK